MQEIKEINETWCLSILLLTSNVHVPVYFLAFSLLGTAFLGGPSASVIYRFL